MNAINANAEEADLYIARDFPIFQNLVFASETAARDCLKGDLVLTQDSRTGLVFNRCFKPELMQYNSDYQNEQAVSQRFRQHLHDVAELIKQHFAGLSLIEVGCGKGHFLEQLQREGFQITGCDPIYEGENPAILKRFFTPELGLRGAGIVLRHVLEHLQDPTAFLQDLRETNGGRGKIYIEVPCLDWICAHRAWFDICYEHVNYFRLADFDRMFGEVIARGHTFGGQYIYVIAELASLRAPRCEPQDRFEFPADFCAGIARHVAPLQCAPAGSAAIWGGSTKGVIFAIFMARAGIRSQIVIDINPAKQGKYLPATGLRVHSPAEGLSLLAPGADIFVMNSNYLDEIKHATEGAYNYLTVDHEGV